MPEISGVSTCSGRTCSSAGEKMRLVASLMASLAISVPDYSGYKSYFTGYNGEVGPQDKSGQLTGL